MANLEEESGTSWSQEPYEDPEIILAKQRYLGLLKEKIALVKRDGLAFYKPHAKQDSFHRAAALPDCKWRLWEAGNRSGKSTGGVAEDASFLRGFRPFYPEGDPMRTAGIPQGRPLRGLVVCNDWKKVGEVFTSTRGDQGKLWKFLPGGYATDGSGVVKYTHTNSEGVIDVVELFNGSVLNFTTVRAWMTNPGSVESVDHDFVHFDEPLPKKMFVGIKRGLIDRKGKGWFTLTPKTEPWIHHMFFPSRRIKADVVIEGRKWAQKGSTYENPYLPQEEIKEFESDLTRDEIDCLVHGIPLALSGLVYKEFNYNKHVILDIEPWKNWKAFNDPPKDATIYVAIDPHPQTPHHVMFLAALPHDVLVVYDEIFLHCPIPELAKLVKERLAGRFYVLILCDPYAWLEHPNTKVNSYAEDFAEAGLHIYKASKDRSAGILEVKRLLVTPNKLFFSHMLEETIYEFETHAWDERENKPKDENDHAMENLGRLSLERPVWIDNSVKAQSINPTEFTRPEYELDQMSYLDSNVDSELS